MFCAGSHWNVACFARDLIGGRLFCAGSHRRWHVLCGISSEVVCFAQDLIGGRLFCAGSHRRSVVLRGISSEVGCFATDVIDIHHKWKTSWYIVCELVLLFLTQGDPLNVHAAPKFSEGFWCMTATTCEKQCAPSQVGICRNLVTLQATHA